MDRYDYEKYGGRPQLLMVDDLQEELTPEEEKQRALNLRAWSKSSTYKELFKFTGFRRCDGCVYRGFLSTMYPCDSCDGIALFVAKSKLSESIFIDCPKCKRSNEVPKGNIAPNTNQVCKWCRTYWCEWKRREDKLKEILNKPEPKCVECNYRNGEEFQASHANHIGLIYKRAGGILLYRHKNEPSPKRCPLRKHPKCAECDDCERTLIPVGRGFHVRCERYRRQEGDPTVLLRLSHNYDSPPECPRRK